MADLILVFAFRPVAAKHAFTKHEKTESVLLLQTVGSRVSRQDESRYPILAEYRAIHDGSIDINTFLHVDPVSILGCVPDMAYHAAKLIHKEGSLDSLAMLTAVTVQTALALGMKVSSLAAERCVKCL